jgi:ABC-2 type transport system permease protein
MERLRPYAAAFAARFQTMLQYRAAAMAGFVTQCWWGGLKVMIYAAFYTHAADPGAAPMTLSQAVTYTWISQSLMTLQPWSGDPDIGAAVRSGAVGYDRLRPVDNYAWWFVRATAWMTARALPRAALMIAFAGVALPLLGLGDWAWKLPADAAQAGLFVLSLGLMIPLSASFVMLLNLCIAASLTDRGINTFAPAFVIMFSGNMIPLGFFPDWAQPLLIAQPFAGMLDIPIRIYIGTLSGGAAWTGLALQAFWILVFVAVGRGWMTGVMRRLEVQGG